MESLESRDNAILSSILTCRIGGTEADTLSISQIAFNEIKAAVLRENSVRTAHERFFNARTIEGRQPQSELGRD
jgi:hypothetical protein